MKITQQTINYGSGKETVICVNGCAIAYAVYHREGCPSQFGFVVKSFAADDNSKIVARGKDWTDVRRKARQYAKDNYQRHVDFHNAA